MRSRLPAVVLFAGLSLTCGCTEPGEITSMGATTGGVIGAGLGAVVGNQTGSTGGGMALGLLAGSASGAWIGNALEAEQRDLDRSAEMLNQRERLIAEQRAAINRMRNGIADSDSAAAPAYRSNSFSGRSPVAAASAAAAPTGMGSVRASGRSAAGLGSPRSVAPSSPSEVGERDLLDGSGEVPAPAKLSSPLGASSGGADCREAEHEVSLAARTTDPAERLLRLRNALRICPDSAQLHMRMAEAYEAVGRHSDAEFERAEALRLDPTVRIVGRRNVPRREDVSMREQNRY